MQMFDLFGTSMFTIDKFLNTLNDKFRTWAGLVVGIIGAIVFVAGLWKCAKGFISDRAQTNWPMAIAGLVLGGALMVGGYALLQSASNDVLNELESYG